MGGPADPVLLDILNGRDADGVAEAAQAFAATDKSTCGNLGCVDLLGKVLLNILKHGFDALPIPEGLL